MERKLKPQKEADKGSARRRTSCFGYDPDPSLYVTLEAERLVNAFLVGSPERCL